VDVQSGGFYRLTLNAEEPITAADFANFQIAIPEISVENASVREGDRDPDNPDRPTANLEFTVLLSEPTVVPVTVNYETADQSATVGRDYQLTADTLVFAPGETEKTVTVPVLGDEEVESEETLLLLLSSGGGPAAGGIIIDNEATGTIANDDLPSGRGRAGNRFPTLPYKTGLVTFTTSGSCLCCPFTWVVYGSVASSCFVS